MGFNALPKLTKGPSTGLDMGADLSPSLVLWDKIYITEEFAYSLKTGRSSRCESTPQKWAYDMNYELWSQRVNSLETF